MRGFHGWSIGTKLTLIIMGTSSISLLLATLALASYDLHALRRSRLDDLSALADIIGSNSSAALIFNDPAAARDVLHALTVKQHVVEACIYSPDGSVFATYTRSLQHQDFVPPPVESDGARYREDGVIFFRSIGLAGERVGTVYLKADGNEIKEHLRTYTIVFLIVVGTALLVTYVLSVKLQSTVSEPIRHLAWTTKMVSLSQDYSLRAEKRSDDEVGLLIDGFNAMLGQIQQRDSALQKAHSELERRVEERTALLEQEIAEHQQAEEARRVSEERTRLLLDSTAEAIFGIDLQGLCTFCNPACVRMLGYRDARQLLGRNIHDLIHHSRNDGTAYPVEECKIDQAFRLGEGSHVDDEVLWRADGTSFPVEYWSYPIRRAGEAVGAVVTFVDITERQLAVEALTKMSSSLQQTADMVVIADKNGVIEYVNPAFEAQTGYTKEMAIGQTPRILKSGKRDKSFYEALWGKILSGEVFRGLMVNRRKNGDLYYEEKTIAPVKDSRGAITHFVSVGRDITARKRVEAELRSAKEAAEAANRAKSEFLANMSHEIRTPMNGIIGMTELALDTELNTEQREYLTLVKSSADSLLGVINDILDFSKIEAGKLDLDRLEFTLRNTVSETLKTIALRAHKKGVELTFEVAAGIPERLHGDPGRLRQVLVNLVGNAIKFTERGEVVVRVEIAGQASSDVQLLFVVHDTGIGIPADKLKHIFQPFVQADSSTTRRYGGTGLGLTISKRLVEMMGGKLWVESEPGCGSTVQFTANFGLPENATSAARPIELEQLRGVPVLVADDNATNRHILARMLSRWKLQPCLVSGGVDALAALQSAHGEGRPFPLALLDGRMPDLSGFAVAEQIQQHPELAKTAILMLTSDLSGGDAARARRLSAVGHLIKPITESDLLHAILRALGEQDLAQAQTIAAKTRPDARADRPLRVLLTEDNPVNRALAVRLLERRGHSVVVAGNGRRALAALEESGWSGFDVVLMDVQMPEMDGFEATATIRRREQQLGSHVPIIAMTAHAMKGDRERCLEAGMDGYVSKPVCSGTLFAEIERLVSRAEPEPAHCRPCGLDRKALLDRLEGDHNLLQEMTAIFLRDCPRLLEAIREALTANDAESLARAAHTLKGAVSNFSAAAATAAALRLEQLGRQGNLTGAAEALAALEAEIEQLKPELAELTQEVPQ